MNEHQTDKNSHVIIIYPATKLISKTWKSWTAPDTVRKLEFKEMLYTRQLKPTVNRQTEGELYERDMQKCLSKKPKNEMSIIKS